MDNGIFSLSVEHDDRLELHVDHGHSSQDALPSYCLQLFLGEPRNLHSHHGIGGPTVRHFLHCHQNVQLPVDFYNDLDDFPCFQWVLPECCIFGSRQVVQNLPPFSVREGGHTEHVYRLPVRYLGNGCSFKSPHGDREHDELEFNGHRKRYLRVVFGSLRGDRI